MLNFEDAVFDNVAKDAVAYIYDPPAGWATIDDCGQWPCTGPENIVIKFTGTTYAGEEQPFDYPDWQIAGDFYNTTTSWDGCEKQDQWGAWLCENEKINILLFESLDADTEDRSVQPVKLYSWNWDYLNLLNSMMDHCWDGFYTCQLRLSRFPVQIAMDKDYVMEFTGTPPGAMRFKLDESEGAGTMIRIKFPESAAYQVIHYSTTTDGDGNEVTTQTAENAWDTDVGGPAHITKKNGCGEWRYKGVDNDLDFYLTPGCDIEIRKRDAVLCNVRMEWTLDDFYADGGTSSFADRVAAALGVHRSQVKVVAVYYGSVNVEYAITALPDEEFYEELGITDDDVAEADLDELLLGIEETLVTMVAASTIDFGATVIAADVGGGNELVATELSSAGFGASASTVAQTGISATDALASFALLMVPTVMVLSREPEILEVLGELYNSATDAEEQQEQEEEE
jgi:hypothetical protein